MYLYISYPEHPRHGYETSPPCRPRHEASKKCPAVAPGEVDSLSGLGLSRPVWVDARIGNPSGLASPCESKDFIFVDINHGPY